MKPKADRTLMEQMEIVPPCLARMMAVNCGKGNTPTLKPIADIQRDAVDGSGTSLSMRTVQRLVWRADWKTVDVDVASAFLVGCGVRIFNQTQLHRFIDRYVDKNFPHITDPRMFCRFYKLMELPIDESHVRKLRDALDTRREARGK